MGKHNLMSDRSGIGEQALNKAAEIGLSSQLDEVENLEVDIETDPLKLVQGQVDSVTIAGVGLVMQKDLRVEELEMQMTSVAINPLSAAFGKIELTRPTDATVHVVLTEADINRAFNSNYVRSKLYNLQVKVNGQPKTIDAQKVYFHLPGKGEVALEAKVVVDGSSETRQVVFTAVPRVTANGQTVTLENVHYGEGDELSPELTEALVSQTSDIINLSNFDLAGMSLRIKSLNAEAGKLTFEAEAHVEQIPSG